LPLLKLKGKDHVGNSQKF